MRRRFAVPLLTLAAALALSACGNGGNANSSASQKDSSVVAKISHALREKYPLPYLTDSSDLHNQIEYAKVQSDPNKIEYLEFLSLSGQPIGFFTIRGQVSAEATRITSPVKDVCNTSGDSGISCLQDPQPDLTGTYFSQSGGGYFAYLTSGALIQWPASVQFITSDQPFKTNVPTTLNINENAPISQTHAHTQTAPAPTPAKK